MRSLPFAPALALALLTILVLPASAPSAEPPLNVLFLSVDDLGPILGPSKPPGLLTPHLDRLAARGVFFDRAYCQIPLCNPSRASVLTGLRPDTLGVFDLDRHFRDQLPRTITLPQLFKNHGWFSGRVGKIYHYNVPAGIGTDGLDDPPSWTRVINPKGRDVFDEALITNPTPAKAISAALSWLAADGTDEEQTDGMIVTEAISLLESHRDSPFFLGTGLFRPHTPFVAPRKYFDLYPLETIQLPQVPPGDRDDIPAAAIPHNIPEPDYGLPESDLRQSLQAYYACTTFVDAQVGRLLDALDRLDLTSRTLIVFWSDHGYHLGQHHLWQKRTLFDESARAPVIIAWPQGAAAHGKVCSQVVEFIDLYPTIADLAGLEAPPYLEGRSLRPLLENPSLPWNGTAWTQVLRPGDGNPVMGRALTTDRWRLIDWNGGAAGIELYDHRSDPREITNLAQDPSLQDLILTLRTLLQRVSGQIPPEPFNPARL